MSEMSKKQNEDSAFRLPATAVPFGYLQCTCDDSPKVICMNEQMKELLLITVDRDPWDLFLMIPPSDWERIKSELKSVVRKSEPLKIRHTLVKTDGEMIHAEGWVGVFTEKEEKYISLIYTQCYTESNGKYSFLRQSLKKEFDYFFEMDLSMNRLSCFYSDMSEIDPPERMIRMPLDQATEFWIDNYVEEEDKEKVRSYFNEVCTAKSSANVENVKMLMFSGQDKRQKNISYLGVTICMDETTILFCCANLNRILFGGNNAKMSEWKNLKSLLNRYFKELKHVYGALIFRMMPNECMKFIYATDNVCQFLEIDEARYLENITKGVDCSKFLRICKKHGVKNLKQVTQEEPAYFIHSFTGEKIQAKCITLTGDLYELIAYDDSKTYSPSIGIPKEGIFIRMFGYFNIFVNGSPIIFPKEKQKELMALLVHRGGANLTQDQAIRYLWEKTDPDESLREKYRKVAYDLTKTLKAQNIEYILKDSHGVRCVDPTKFQCDYYEYLNGNPLYRRGVHNQYLLEYEWAEGTMEGLWHHV